MGQVSLEHLDGSTLLATSWSWPCVRWLKNVDSLTAFCRTVRHSADDVPIEEQGNAKRLVGGLTARYGDRGLESHGAMVQVRDFSKLNQGEFIKGYLVA